MVESILGCVGFVSGGAGMLNHKFVFEEHLNSAISERVEGLLEARRILKKELSDAAGLPPASLSHLLRRDDPRRRRRWRASEVLAVALVLGVSPNFLLTGLEVFPPPGDDV